MTIPRKTNPWEIAALTMRGEQRRSIQSGAALSGHCDSAHGGKVSADCSACAEIMAKMDHPQKQHQSQQRLKGA